VIRKETARCADEGERDDDVKAEDLNLRRQYDQDELEHVHEHVERVLDAVNDPAFRLKDRLLHELRHD